MRLHFISRILTVAGLLAFLVTGGARPAVSSQEKAGPAALKASLENTLRKHGILMGDNVQVAIENNVVVLTGTVQSLGQKEQAGRDASSSAKGYRVQNDLSLAKTDLTPEAIAEKIAAALEKSPDYGIFDWCGLVVTTEGAVTLKGWVYYPWKADQLVRVVQGQPGVTKTVNELRPILSSDSDGSLRLLVARLIYRRPTGLNFPRMTGPVHILVDNGEVILAGTVNSEKDSQGYESLVRFNTGAFKVINELKVKGK